jgi:phage tail sheath protein FI
MTMAVQVSYPGVYIEEFAPGAPITGVGTSTAAFVGVASAGELDTPTKITSWERFKETFGAYPVPGYHLWYAVRGFFDNGGQVCYVVRASNGGYGSLMLPDRSSAGNDVIEVRARQPGDQKIEVAVTGQTPLAATDTELYRATGPFASIAGREVTMGVDGVTPAETVAARFRAGDWITIGTGGERVQLVRVSGAGLRLGADLAGSYTAGTDTVRLADAPAGQQTLRLRYLPGATWSPVPAGSLTPGTVLTIDPDTKNEAHVIETVQAEYLPEGISYRVTFRDGLYAPLSLASAVAVQTETFDLTVTLGTSSQTYASLSIDSAHERYFVSTINDDAASLVSVSLVEPPPAARLPDSLPKDLPSTEMTTLGAPENLTTLGDGDFIDALVTLEAVDDVNLVACPDSTSTAVQQVIVQHCELLADRFAVLDARPGLEFYSTGVGDSVEEQRQTLDSTRGYAALYYPWLRVRPTGSGDPVLVPPSGHVCGIIARSDNSRGVHKAPANEIVGGALGLERSMSNGDQGQLNLQGINVIRILGGSQRPILWGARTTATDANWRYVNIRRLFLFVEESIQEGIVWAIFEPNNHQLWQKLKRTINEFLARIWRDGGLFGATPEEAWYVKIDETNNPFPEQALGRLHIEIGLRPTYPAEFIVVRIGIWPGGGEVTES